MNTLLIQPVQLFFICILFYSCNKYPNVEFDKPQPEGIADQQKFSDILKGEYIDEKDSTRVIVSDRMILSVKSYDKKFHRNEIDTTPGKTMSNEAILSALKGDGIKANFNGDSIYMYSKIVDTLFIISDKNVLRCDKKIHYLNLKQESGYWMVGKLDLLPKRGVRFSSLKTFDSTSIREIVKNTTVTRGDSGKIETLRIAPTPKEFKKLIQKKLFRKETDYIKVRK